jgi:hypothetical protein
MCAFSQPDIPPPAIATETASARMPDAGAGAAAGDAQRNRMRAGASTILTSGSGVMSPASTQKKTLLGA